MGIDDAIEAERARELIASSEVIVLDVRGDEEWQEKRVAGAKRAPGDAIEKALEDLDSERAVLIVCEDGRRSSELAEELRESGREAAHLEGGMAAWESEKLPMQPSEDVDDDATI
jgi:rhodanese-related sulfurtransferase